ncbi:hypothetical protein SRHO_G00080110 [Serrasalmus rhombeus]
MGAACPPLAKQCCQSISVPEQPSLSISPHPAQTGTSTAQEAESRTRIKETLQRTSGGGLVVEGNNCRTAHSHYHTRWMSGPSGEHRLSVETNCSSWECPRSDKSSSTISHLLRAQEAGLLPTQGHTNQPPQAVHLQVFINDLRLDATCTPPW